ncbi:MAG: excinuclease ABC subunit UvrA [Thermoguttaceae bacterium]
MTTISLHGVRVHNLKGIDLDLPTQQLIVFCGLSGSGKSSLALDTLYAEGQRRYIESFSAYTRQFLERMEKPDAQSLEGIPAAVAITAHALGATTRASVGSATETLDYLRLLYAKLGSIRCHRCGRNVRRDSPDTILSALSARLATSGASSQRAMIAFAPPRDLLDSSHEAFRDAALRRGFVRGIAGGVQFRCDDDSLTSEMYAAALAAMGIEVEAAITTTSIPTTTSTIDDDANGFEEQITDDFGEDDNVAAFQRQTSDEDDEATEDVVSETPAIFQTRFYDGDTEIAVSAPVESVSEQVASQSATESGVPPLLLVVDRVVLGDDEGDPSQTLASIETALDSGDDAVTILWEDGNVDKFSRRLRCEECGIDYPTPQVAMLSDNNPLGACPMCEGFGTLLVYDLERIVPQRYKTLRDGAIAPHATPAFKTAHDELLARCPALDLSPDKPLESYTPDEWRRLLFGRGDAPGLAAFFEKLHRQKYKMPMRVFLSRWRSHRVCPQCHGARLRPEALAIQIAGKNISELLAMRITDLAAHLDSVAWTPWEEKVGRVPLSQICVRINYLIDVGLGYLTLDRSVRSLSGGEQRRVALTSVLGSSLVNMLYVLDEPTMGLHPSDIVRLMKSIGGLRDRGNTVIVVDHDEEVLRVADHIVELGPEAGERGGQVVFQGSLEEMLASQASLTGSYLSGKRSSGVPLKRRAVRHGMIELFGATGHNLQDVRIAFPLGMLCVVTGVSGAGKTSLVQETLYPAIQQTLHRDTAIRGLPYRDIQGTSQIDDVVMVTQTPIGRSMRSNPVTYLKVFDEIRQVFASTLKARTNNYTAGYFSFNVDGGRCNTCKGEGFIAIDMHFMADMYVRCPVCHGTRYQREILEVTYRDKTIADVLAMTAREAFGFFRGQPKVQQRLKPILDVGLDYVQLGQAASTLSGGESQRLKLAAYLSQVKKGRTLFLMDEPTSGLHFGDVVQLLDCFGALIETGHSLIVVEHDLQMMKAADWIIDVGPGAAEAGGRIVSEGTPEDIAGTDSPTGCVLRKAL